MPKSKVKVTFYPLIVGYTGGFDKHGRAIVYVKIGRNEKLEDSVTYQKLLMYTVERYITYIVCVIF
jgi:hypothetical protein